MIASRAWRLAIGLAALSPAAFAYYHYTHYNSRAASLQPILEKFDLTALPAKTVSFFLSDQPAAQAALDSLPGLVSQLRLAANVWNNIDASDLRIAYGGFESASTVQNGPGIDIVFDDLPPGLVALGGPSVRADMSAGVGQFVPILRSKLVLSRDLTQRPSYGEAFFNTVVHEFGHTLGLQHTFSSGVMATEVTRATSKANPISPDDIAGLTLLYPARAPSTGSISGRVALGDGTAVNLASVVALQPNGAVISALSNPDGSYRIDGLAPGQYLLYAHPLPPPLTGEVTPGNLVLPTDLQGQVYSVGSSFSTVFYPGVRDYNQAISVPVSAGAVSGGYNFSVQRRAAPALYAIQAYTNIGSLAVRPPFLNFNADRSWIGVTGVGLTINNRPAPGLGVAVIGGSAVVVPNGIQAFSGQFISIDFQFLNPFSAPEGPRHLVFSLGDDIYVLPGGFQQVQRAPPSIRSVAAGFDGTGTRVVTLTGTNLMPDARILFDGQVAQVRSASIDGTQLVVTPPPGATGYRAVLVALNGDGQSSLFLQGSNPPLYAYDAVDAQPIALSLTALPAGVDTMVDLFGSNFDSTTVLGFGSSDVFARKVWAVTPNHLVANVHVSANAAAGSTDLSVTAGFQVVNLPGAFQIQPASPRLMVLTSVQNLNGGASLQAGGLAVVNYTNPPFVVTASNVQLSVAGIATPILATGFGQLFFQVPSTLQPGPAAVRLTAGADFVYPIAAQIDPALPAIASVVLQSGTLADTTHPAHPGDLLMVVVSNLGDISAGFSPTRATINVGGLDHPALGASPVTGQTGTAQIIFALSAQASTGSSVPLTVTVDGRTSAPYLLSVSR